VIESGCLPELSRRGPISRSLLSHLQVNYTGPPSHHAKLCLLRGRTSIRSHFAQEKASRPFSHRYFRVGIDCILPVGSQTVLAEWRRLDEGSVEKK
jgi:hypothetical protein